MNVLAIETSTEYLSLALQVGKQLYTRDILAGQTHSQQILPQIKTLLDEANVSIKQINGIAFGAGPGSFTGVRIACGVAQGLAYGINVPVIGVNTLQALAAAAGEKYQANRVIACLDARMGEVYHAVYVQEDGVWQEVMPASVCKPEATPVLQEAQLKADAKGVCLGAYLGAGSGWATYTEILSRVYQGQLSAMAPECLPTATAVLRLAQAQFMAGSGIAAAEAMPIYIRNKVALKMSERIKA